MIKNNRVQQSVDDLVVALCETAQKQNTENHDGLETTVESIARLLEASGGCPEIKAPLIGFLQNGSPPDGEEE